MTQAFPHDTAGLSAGEAMIFHPDGHGGSPVVARVKINGWARLAAAR